MEYCISVRNQEEEEIRYRAYISDALRVLAEGKVFRDEIERWVDPILESRRQRVELQEGEATARICAKLSD